jgi:hypothetical protein
MVFPIVPVVLSAAALGGLAYALSQASPASPTAPPSPPDAPPSKVGIPGLAVIPRGPGVYLQTGWQYLAKLRLTGLEQAFGSAGAVKSKLEGLGFKDVTVWASNPAWYFPDRTPFPSGATYWAQGVYTRPAGVVARPSQIEIAWVNPGMPADPPPPNVSGAAWGLCA